MKGFRKLGEPLFSKGLTQRLALGTRSVAGGVSDTTAPTVAITSSESSPSFANPIPLTFTLSEISTDFAVGDITVGAGGAIGNFAGSGTSYTADLTITTAAATVTVDVAADSFHDAAGNGNTAATQFSITSALHLFDQFTTADAAPMTSPRTCEPGPGTLTITDTGNNISTAGGALVFANGTSTWGQTKAVGGSITRATGLGLYVSLTPSNNFHGFLGGQAATDHNPNTADAGIYLTNGLNMQVADNGGVTGIVGVFVAGTAYKLALVYRSAGCFMFIKGGAFAEWTLLWVGVAANATDVFPMITNHSAAPSADNMRAAQLAAPFVTDYGIATQQLAGARNAGDTFIHEANCLIGFNVTTVPSADQIELRFRMQDATNYWQVTIDSTGALDLDEVVTGTPTQRGTAAGVIVNGDRIVIIATAAIIRVFEANVLRITYVSASNFQTETDGELETEGTGGSVSDIVSWPRTLSGASLTELNKLVP